MMVPSSYEGVTIFVYRAAYDIVGTGVNPGAVVDAICPDIWLFTVAIERYRIRDAGQIR